MSSLSDFVALLQGKSSCQSHIKPGLHAVIIIANTYLLLRPKEDFLKAVNPPVVQAGFSTI